MKYETGPVLLSFAKIDSGTVAAKSNKIVLPGNADVIQTTHARVGLSHLATKDGLPGVGGFDKAIVSSCKNVCAVPLCGELSLVFFVS